MVLMSKFSVAFTSFVVAWIARSPGNAVAPADTAACTTSKGAGGGGRMKENKEVTIMNKTQSTMDNSQ
jgi:hypothetical protein